MGAKEERGDAHLVLRSQHVEDLLALEMRDAVDAYLSLVGHTAHMILGVCFLCTDTIQTKRTISSSQTIVLVNRPYAYDVTPPLGGQRAPPLWGQIFQ